MKIDVFTEENEQVFEIKENRFSFNELQNEFGVYYQLTGLVKMIFPEKEILIRTETLNGDMFGLLYSVNDYLEFGFVSVTFNDKKTDFEYEGHSSTEVKIIFDKNWYVAIENEFLLAITSVSFDFFEHLWLNTKDEKYKMYMDVAESLKQRITI